MNTPLLRPFLNALPLFSDLTTAQTEVLGEHASAVTFAAGRVIFRYGEPADSVYLIRDGRVSLEVISPHEGSVTLQSLGAGEVLGFSWLFPPYQWYFDARALAVTHAVALDARRLRASCDRDPAFGYALMKCFSAVLHSRMQAARLQLLDLYGPRAETT